MRKIPTLFLRGESGAVVDAVNPVCQWVLDGCGTATVQYDGACVMFDGDGWYTRRKVAASRQPPEGFIAVQADAAVLTGWEPYQRSSLRHWLSEAIGRAGYEGWEPGTYELIGPRVNDNAEQAPFHTLIRHGQWVLPDVPRDFYDLRMYLASAKVEWGMEGIVFWFGGPADAMAKIKAGDYAF